MKFKLTKRKAVKIYGTQADLARELGVTRQCVGLWEWDKPIPDKHALRIRYELRPDAFKSAAA